MKKPPKQPTHTSKVVDALAHAENDFMSLHQLMAATGSTNTQVSAALYHMRKFQVVDVVIEPDGTGWWFLTGDDQRTKIIDDRTPEVRSRRPRRTQPKE